MVYNYLKYNMNKRIHKKLEALLSPADIWVSVCVNSAEDERLPLATCWRVNGILFWWQIHSSSLSPLFLFLPSSHFFLSLFVTLTSPWSVVGAALELHPRQIHLPRKQETGRSLVEQLNVYELTISFSHLKQINRYVEMNSSSPTGLFW